MTRLFEVVRELSGHSSSISIPRPYIKFCEGNHTHAAVLSQLVFWSGTKSDGEWFYKSNDELGEELCLSCDQVRYAIRQLKKRLDGVIISRVKKANGVPTTHYQIDGNKLVELMFPQNKQDSQMDLEKLPEQNQAEESEHNSQMETVILPDGNGNITESKRENSQNLGSGNFTDSINRSKPDTNKQIIPLSPPEGEGQQDINSVVMDSYNEFLGQRFVFCKTLNDKRKRSIKKFVSELESLGVDSVADYFQAFNASAGDFYAGVNDRGWRASFDYVLRSDVVVRVVEGSLGGQVARSLSDINDSTDWIYDMDMPEGSL